MATFHKEETYDVTADQMWNRIKDFFGVHTWLPGITATKPDAEVKNARRVTLDGGAEVVEQLVDGGPPRSQRYRFVSGPLPIETYESFLRVEDAGKGCVVKWDATFEPKGVTETELKNILLGFYDGGLAALKKKS